MPRYYFDLVDDKTILDHQGTNLPDVNEARKYATTFARELMETKAELLGEFVFAWSVRVSDGSFQKVLTVPFSQVAPDDPPKNGNSASD